MKTFASNLRRTGLRFQEHEGARTAASIAFFVLFSAVPSAALLIISVGWAIRAASEDAIPWHRVVNGKGGISTDGEHPGLQRAMLEAEGVVFDARGLVDLEAVGWRPVKKVALPARRKSAARAKGSRRARPRS